MKDRSSDSITLRNTSEDHTPGHAPGSDFAAIKKAKSIDLYNSPKLPLARGTKSKQAKVIAEITNRENGIKPHARGPSSRYVDIEYTENCGAGA